MVRKILAAAAMLAAFVLPSAAAAAVPLRMPEPIVLARALDVGTVRDAIVVAAARRKWITESDSGDAFVARLNVRRHVLRVRIEYEPRKLRFTYVDSENLDYEIEDGVPMIHRNVMPWVEALSLEIQRELQVAVFASNRLDIVDPAGAAPAPPPVPAAAAPAPPPVAEPPPSANAPPLVAPTPARPAGLAPGGVAHVRVATPLRGRPMLDAAAGAPLAAGASVQLVSSTRNLAGVWWYVNSGSETGWLPESALRP